MKIHAITLILCFIGTVSCGRFSNIQSNLIDSTTSVGEFVNIGHDVVTKPNSQIGSFSSIAPNTIIGENSKVGSFSRIGSQCHIGNSVNIQEYSNIGNGNTIGNNSNLRNYCSVGNNAMVGNLVKMDQFSSIGDSAEIGDKCMLAKYSSVGNNGKLQSKVYVGMYSFIGPFAMIGESSIIQKFVEIPNGATVKPNQVIIRTPTSFDLYQKCTPDISEELARSAANTMNGGISSEFNNMLRQLIDDELNSLSSSCIQSNIVTKPRTLPQIIGLYLMHYHGPELKNVELVKQNCIAMSRPMLNINGLNLNGQSVVIVNGVRLDSPQLDPALWQLKNEMHFGENSTKTILETDVMVKMNQLRAIDQDAERDNDNRMMSGDSYCEIIEQIRNGEREVAFAKPNIQTSQIRSNYC